MKVLLVNGSPHRKGCTYTALTIVAEALNQEGIETEIMQLGTEPIGGCIACMKCAETGRCFRDDIVNKFVDKIDECDGFVFGSPVHFAAASGAISSFMDRAFFVRGTNLAYKPGACVISCRRGGASAAFDELNKYFTIRNMQIGRAHV